MQLRSGLAGQSLTGVVDVIDVYSAQAKVLPAFGEAISHEPWGETVSTTDDLIGSNDFLIDELPAHIAQVFVARRWRRAVERDVPALRAHHELLARRGTRGDDLLNRRTDGALGPLASVVDRRIDQVDARADRGVNGRLVRCVVRVRVVAQIRSDPDRRHGRTERGGAKEVRSERRFEPPPKPRGAGLRRTQHGRVDAGRRRERSRRSLWHENIKSYAVAHVVASRCARATRQLESTFTPPSQGVIR